MENSTSQESCALNPDGQLKDASKITFYNSETNETPLAPVDEQAEQPVPKPRKVTKKPMGKYHYQAQYTLTDFLKSL